MKLIFCILNCLLVFIFYSHTLNYSWKIYDEHILYNESILPTPTSFSEIFEIISSFGLNNHFESSNPIYSNISVIRGTPVDTIFCLFFFYLFKKSVFAYHAFSLLLHILNTCFCFLILNNISFNKDNVNSLIKQLLISLLTLLWALHPVNVESILFATNFGALVTYFFCFLFLFYYINLNKNTGGIHELPLHHSMIIFLLYLFPLFLNEYSVTLPVILLFYICIMHSTSFLKAFKQLLPMFLALIIFVIYFFTKPEIRNINEGDSLITLQRILFFAPQVFFHYLKLILIPINLSIDQGAFVTFSKSIFEPYGIFCSILMLSTVLLLIISFIFVRKRIFFSFFVLFFPFFFSLIPFLHIISPLYNIASERYLYLPLFFLVFGFAHVLFLVFENTTLKNHYRIMTLLIIFLCFLGTKTYIRTLDWKNSFTLLDSAVKIAPNNLYKGLRLYMISGTLKSLPDSKEDVSELYNKKALNYFKKAMKDFKNERRKYQAGMPEVLKFYGIDPDTLLRKIAYLLALSEMKSSGDPYKALTIFSPYAKNLTALNTTILDFYYKLLFNTKNIEQAEEVLLKSLKQNKLSPTLFVALSDLFEFKYNDLTQTKKYLNLSFKYFPYDEGTLFGLRKLYKQLGDAEKFAFYSYLNGLRTHDIVSLEEAALVYMAINKKEKAGKIINKLLKDHPDDIKVQEINSKYKIVYGEHTK